MDEEYLLKWKDYQSNFFSLAEELFMSESLTDVTLCCRDQVGREKIIMNASIYAFFDYYTCYVQYTQFFWQLGRGDGTSSSSHNCLYRTYILEICVFFFSRLTRPTALFFPCAAPTSEPSLPGPAESQSGEEGRRRDLFRLQENGFEIFIG